jgi:hypothetical protein
MKLEESMAGKYSKMAGTCSELAGTSFTIGKNKILIKILAEERLGIGIIVEFSRILTGFPNQVAAEAACLVLRQVGELVWLLDAIISINSAVMSRDEKSEC